MKLRTFPTAMLINDNLINATMTITTVLQDDLWHARAGHGRGAFAQLQVHTHI